MNDNIDLKDRGTNDNGSGSCTGASNVFMQYFAAATIAAQASSGPERSPRTDLTITPCSLDIPLQGAVMSVDGGDPCTMTTCAPLAAIVFVIAAPIPDLGVLLITPRFSRLILVVGFPKEISIWRSCRRRRKRKKKFHLWIRR